LKDIQTSRAKTKKSKPKFKKVKARLKLEA